MKAIFYPLGRNFSPQGMQISPADIANHGASGGFNGLTYYSDTTKLYHQYHEDIWRMLNEDCHDQGYKSILEFIASFNESAIDDDEQFKNLLVWYAAEKVVYEITQGEYPDDEEDDTDE